MKKRIALILTMLLVGVGAVFLISPSQATTEEKCYEQVIDQPAYDEPVAGTPSQWWNWSPNKDQGPFDGPPAFPTDDRGTWQGPHTEGGPGQDQVGTFQQGEGHGSWFHREAGTPDSVIHHDATYKTVEVPCDEPTVTPPTEEPPIEEPPVEEPPVEEPPTTKAPTTKHPEVAPVAGLPNTGA